MKTIPIFLCVTGIALFSIFPGCTPSEELIEENDYLYYVIDSLKLQNEQCSKLVQEWRVMAKESEADYKRAEAERKELAARIQNLKAPTAPEPHAKFQPPDVSVADLAKSPPPPGEVQPAEKVPQDKWVAPDIENKPKPAPPRIETAPPPPAASRIPTAKPPQASMAFMSRYQTALTAFKNREFTYAEKLFQDLLAEEPENRLTDNCEYWLGEIQYAKGNYQGALEYFNNILRYRYTDKDDDALLMKGNCLRLMGNERGARQAWRKLISEHPDSEISRHREKETRPPDTITFRFSFYPTKKPGTRRARVFYPICWQVLTCRKFVLSR
ncbi:MAG: tetratricopeptide repeat protein [Chlorobi bacterium]|nr:tetratricopeptide repeat protein [Chlorobiota bacterium]